MATGFEPWLTVGFERRVLVVARTVTTVNRLLDALTLFENDHRVQVVFTYNEHRPAILGAGVPALLQRLGVAVVAWERAVGERFDLVIAASENDDLHLLGSPVVLLPHGIGFQKYYPGGTVIAGMDPRRLVRDEQVVPALIAVTHEDQIHQLRRVSPPAADRARVVGDPCLDRINAGTHRAGEYREALGAAGRKLVTIASTWGPASLLGTHPRLPLRLVSELPVDEFAVCLVLHPGITAAHGPWQVEAWLAQARQAGLRVIPPDSGWQTAITAANCVITDSGSVALYAASQDLPVLLAEGEPATLVPGSPAAALAARAPRLTGAEPLPSQLAKVLEGHVAGCHEEVVRRAVAVPGRSAALLRAAFYELMGLPEPAGDAEFTSHEPVRPVRTAIAAYVTGAVAEADSTTLLRFPATDVPHQVDHQHLSAHCTRASLRQLSAAAIVFTDLPEAEHGRFAEWAADTLRRWPDAHLAAARLPGRCLVRSRDGLIRELTPDDPGLDPLLAASLPYLGRTAPAELITVGARTAKVAIRVH
ncbi:hypothetical protein [Amycolatopsis eburnea]|uniref:hypothetical protein n=1 Tax=Amycolatopsis eburnea TaxID=2267691 RepID=UPI001CDC4B98|nr:hypothetical protein [Amycolatopsis eburnea]